MLSGIFGYITAALASHLLGNDTPPTAPVPEQPASLRDEIAALREEVARLGQRLSSGTA
jgi:hypothetical protein